MTRVKRGVIAHKRREKILKYAKGFKWGRKSKERAAHDALMHAWTHAYVGRRHKKQDFRALWQTRIGAGAKQNGLSYSRLISGLKKKGVVLDRKILSEVAQNHPAIFKKITEMAT